MKKIILILVTLAIISACNVDDPDTAINNKNAVEWINKHPKPIIVQKSKVSQYDETYHASLYDNAGEMYDTKRISIPLPDTIQPKKKSINHYTY